MNGSRLPVWVIALIMSCALHPDLPGAVHASNSLGMKLEVLQGNRADHTDGWILEVSDGEGSVFDQNLYRDGILVVKTTITVQSGTRSRRTVVQTDYNDPEHPVQTSRVYENGLIVSESRKERSDLLQTLFEYSQGRMISKRELANGRLVRLTSYWRSVDGTLAGLQVVQTEGLPSYRFLQVGASATVVAEGDPSSFSILKHVVGNPTVTDVWSLDGPLSRSNLVSDEQGNLTIQESVAGRLTASTYRADGKLASRTVLEGPQAGRVSEYLYDGHGELFSELETAGGTLRETIQRWYSDGMEIRREERVADVLVKTVSVLQDGSRLTTLYDAGKPYVDVVHSVDGTKVLSITYR